MNRRGRLSWQRQVGYGFLVLLGLVLLVAGYLALVPPNLGALASHPQPATDYADAAQRFAALQAQASALNPDCATQLLTHGHKTDRAIVFIHGYTNCPKQFAQLGQQFYDLGYNVLLARMPHHGLADPLTDELTHLTAEELVAFGDQLVDLAAGLGDHVTVAGISGGGVVTGWLAQQRPEIELAVLISPAFGFQAIPAPATALVTNVVLLRPDTFTWWDPAQTTPDPNSPMAHSYPRYSMHGLAQLLRVGFAARAGAGRTVPAAGSILVITNANDTSVDNAATAQVVAAWRAHGMTDLTTYEFPVDWHLGHDLIDPGQADQQVAVVYPKLIELITQ